MSQTIEALKATITNAEATLELGAEASQIIINSLNDTNMLGFVGEAIDDLETDDITLVSIILDASASMHDNQQAVRDAYNKLINSLKESKQAGSMLISTRTFGRVEAILHGFKQVSEIGDIDQAYTANQGCTTLYDTLLSAMAGIRTYAQSLNDSGIRTKSIVIVFSDGEDNNSTNSYTKVQALSKDFIMSETYYLVYVGYGSDLDQIADVVGFPNKLTTDATESEIRRTMDLVSKSIIRTSQTQITSTNTFFN